MSRFYLTTLLYFGLFLLLTLVLAPAASATEETPEETTERLQQKYREIQSLRFSFFQSTSGQMTGRPKTGKGNGLFVKTAGETLMRWNYNAPERQVVISDGTTISMYFEKLNQMIISAVDTVQTDVLFSFFTGDLPITENFLILPPEPDRSGGDRSPDQKLQVIQLQPRQSESQIRSIHLWITERSMIRRIELVDYFDTKTTINLSNIEINPIKTEPRADVMQLFSFTPPEGTEIIRN